MRDDRIDYLMEYTFEDPKTGKKYDEQVYIPTEIFCNAMREFADRYFMVNLDGKDSDILKLFSVNEDGLDMFGYNEDFLDICKELYEDTTYYEDDLEEVLDTWSED